jgi:branched-chain amino acid transport system permease protein
MLNLIIHLSNLLLIMAILLVGQQLLLFDCGLLFLGGAAFFAAGGYISAILCKTIGLDPFFTIILSSTICLGFSIIIGYPLIRILKEDYFALATLALAQACYVALRSFAPGGISGMAGIDDFHSPFSLILPDGLDSLIIHLLIAGLCLTFIKWIRIRRFGILVSAAHSDETALSTMGYRTTLLKVQVFAIAGFLAALAGALHAHYLGALEPRMSSIQQTVLILCGTILSGKKSVFGTLIGASFIVVLPEILQYLLVSGLGSGRFVFPFVQILYGILIIFVTLLVFPRVRSALRSKMGSGK